jgi:homoserine kinase type II
VVSPDDLAGVLPRWGLGFGRVLPDIPIQGSPERCLDRVVVEAGGVRYLLEELEPLSVARKTAMARHLAHLAAAGLAVAVPLPGQDGKTAQTTGGRTWQLSPFVRGLELNRETYWREGWRGEALAAYLAEMRRAAKGLDLDEPPFDLTAYVRRIEADARRLHPGVRSRLASVFRLLADRLAACPELPLVFSHGDPHPLNVIWGEDRILAAIDWEFCGPKCVLHDVALVLGCVGSEDEEALNGPFARKFLETARTAGLLDAAQEAHLPIWTLALRTAWLAEWLRRGDMEMAEFEVFYMTTLAGRHAG